jgi:hypothetical protein
MKSVRDPMRWTQMHVDIFKCGYFRLRRFRKGLA